MPNNDYKLRKFEKSVLERVKAECEEIREDAVRRQQTELEKAENDALKECYRIIQGKAAQIQSEARKAVSQNAIACRRRVLEQRTQYLDQTVSAVAKRLTAFCEDPAQYRAWLAVSLQKAGEEFARGENRVYLKSRDLGLAGCFRERLGEGCEVVVDDAIEIGGYRLDNLEQGLELDETFDTKLREQRQWLADHSKMDVG